MTSWFQRAKNFLFPEEQGTETKRHRKATGAAAESEQKPGWTAPSGRTGNNSRGKEGAAPPPGARIVKQVVPPPEPVLIEADALNKKKAGIQVRIFVCIRCTHAHTHTHTHTHIHTNTHTHTHAHAHTHTHTHTRTHTHTHTHAHTHVHTRTHL